MLLYNIIKKIANPLDLKGKNCYSNVKGSGRLQKNNGFSL